MLLSESLKRALKGVYPEDRATIITLTSKKTGRKRWALAKGKEIIGKEKVGGKWVPRTYLDQREAIKARDRYNNMARRTPDDRKTNRQKILDAVAAGAKDIRDIARVLGIDHERDLTKMGSLRRDAQALVKKGELKSEIRTRYDPVTMRTGTSQFGGAVAAKRRYFVYSLP